MRVWESWPRFRISRMALSLWRGRARGVYQDFRGQFLASKRGSTLESVEALTEQGDDAQGADPSTLPTSPRCTAIAPESLSASAAISATRQPLSCAFARRTVAEHAAGNYRIMMTMAGELLDAAVQGDAEQLDEKLYLELNAVSAAPPRRVRPGIAR